MKITKKYLAIYFVAVLSLLGFFIGVSVADEASEVKHNLKEMGVVVESVNPLLEVILEEEEGGISHIKISDAYRNLLMSYMATKNVDYLYLEVYRGDDSVKVIELDRKNIKGSEIREYLAGEGTEFNEIFYDKNMIKIPQNNERYFIHSKRLPIDGFELEVIIVSDLEEFISELKEDIFEAELILFSAFLLLIPILLKMNKSRKTIIHKGMLDSLTGLYNRRVYPLVVKKIKKNPENTWVVFCMDMDGLKEINDSMGHSEGDLHIMRFSEILRVVFRKSDYKIRIGGDEFVVVATIAGAVSCEAIEVRLQEESQKSNVSFSTGISIFRGNEIEEVLDFENKIKEADKFMYQNKVYKKSPETEEKVV